MEVPEPQSDGCASFVTKSLRHADRSIWLGRFSYGIGSNPCAERMRLLFYHHPQHGHVASDVRGEQLTESHEAADIDKADDDAEQSGLQMRVRMRGRFLHAQRRSPTSAPVAYVRTRSRQRWIGRTSGK